ncbi:MAG TPA: histidine kinase [Acidimicrobiales bacterium]|nr:histidine kinase [Acidimicrobiales bacterium]
MAIIAGWRRHPGPAGRPGTGGHAAFGLARAVINWRPLAGDAVLAAGFLLVCTGWLVHNNLGLGAGLVQVALVAPLAWRRAYPMAVMVVVAAVALVQWSLDFRVPAAGALLVALYTVAVHQSRARLVVSAAVVEVGVVMAGIRWAPAGTEPRSIVFLTGLVVAAVCGGLAVRAGSEYLSWMDERAARLELERDQQAAISAAEERARIAREMHDVVAHSLSVVITLADAAAVTGRSDPDRAAATMQQVSDVGRQALADMRGMLSALRTDHAEADLGPQPGLADLDALYRQVGSTGLDVRATALGTRPDLPPALELSVYRIVQEALTNTLKHAAACRVDVTVDFGPAAVGIRVHDDGSPTGGGRGGHGLTGMAERAAVHGGRLSAGPAPDGGWLVAASLPYGRP